MPKRRGTVSHTGKVVEAGHSEAMEADNLERLHHQFTNQVWSNAGSHSKNQDLMTTIYMGNVVTQQHLMTLSAIVRGGLAGYAGMENVLGGEIEKTIAQRGLIREGDIGAAAHEAIKGSIGSLSIATLPIVLERLREQVASMAADIDTLKRK